MRQEKLTTTNPAIDAVKASLPTIEEFRGHQQTGQLELVKQLEDFFMPYDLHPTLVGRESASEIGQLHIMDRARMRSLGWGDFKTTDLPLDIQRSVPASLEIMVIRKDYLAKLREEECNASIALTDPKTHAGSLSDSPSADLRMVDAVPANTGGPIKVSLNNT